MDSFLLKIVKFFRGTLSLKEAAILCLHLFILTSILRYGMRFVKNEGMIDPNGLIAVIFLPIVMLFVLANMLAGYGLLRCSKNVSWEWRISKLFAWFYGTYLIISGVLALGSFIISFFI